MVNNILLLYINILLPPSSARTMIYTKILFYWLMLVFIGRCNAGSTGFGCFASCCCGDLDKFDPYLFVGEILNITCTLTEETVVKGVNSSDLYFYFNNNEEVNETTVINNTSLGMSMLMTAPFNKVLFCELKRTVNGIFTTFVDSTFVKVEYPPSPVKNVNCVIYDWNESMECTWDLAQYNDLRDINSALFLLTFQSWQSCPNQELTKCSWHNRDSFVFDQPTLYFTVKVTNKRRNVTASTNLITINQDEYVKPSKVDYLIAKTVNSTCAALEWRHRKIYRRKQFIICINSKWNDNKTMETPATEFSTTSGYFTATICNLKPNTLYNFTIETVPAIGKGYRSDKESNWTVTDISVPGRPPEVVDGAYATDNHDCYKNQRDVAVYWKLVPLEYQNGPMLGYYVSVSDYKGSLYDIAIKDPHHPYHYLTLPCNQQTTLAIRATGKAGSSPVFSKIFIPQHNAIFIPKHVIVEKEQKNSSESTVSISWTPVKHSGIKSYTIFYCQYDTECTNEISWIPVGPNMSSYTIEHLQSDINYRFGVSADVNGSSSGFKWQTCHYFKSSNLRPPSIVKVLAYPENSITVTWSGPVCGNSPYVEYYIITWCIADEVSKQCQGVLNEEKIKSTEETSYVIKNLDTDTIYGIRVQHVAGDGRTSDFSEMKVIKFDNSDILIKAIAGISAGSVFALALTIVGILFIWRTIRRRIKKNHTTNDNDTLQIRGPHWKDMYPSMSALEQTSPNTVVLGEYKHILYVSQTSTENDEGSLASDIAPPGYEIRLENYTQ